jgi:kynureninase
MPIDKNTTHEPHQQTQAYARLCDETDPLASFRDEFEMPLQADGTPHLYFSGNSLGLMPKASRKAVMSEMDAWGALGVNGYFKEPAPWVRFNEDVRAQLAPIVGAKPHEVIVMNTLTVNLHLMMVSFYRPTKTRYKILVERNPFPSDSQAINSQIEFHGFDPKDALITLEPRAGEHTMRQEDIDAVIEAQGGEIALIMIGAVNYYTGQFFELKRITESGHKKGCLVGFDLAHAAGNVPMKLHEWDVDFAVWCHYKYLNGGPACPGAVFVHERFADDTSLPRFAGWWGEDLEERFKMTPTFKPSYGAAGWQLSNAAILSIVPVKAALDIFARAGMDRIRAKSIALTSYMEYLIKELIDPAALQIISPASVDQRGAQLSLLIAKNGKQVFDLIQKRGVICDWREPEIIRIAPAPLYNRFEDVYRAITLLKEAIDRHQ